MFLIPKRINIPYQQINSLTKSVSLLVGDTEDNREPSFSIDSHLAEIRIK